MLNYYYLGIDVSKGYSDFIVLDHSKHPIDKGFQLDDTAAGHRHLEAYVRNFFQVHPEAEVFAALESTGGYENNWYNRLIQLSNSLSLHVARLNPARVKANSKAAAKRNKTDRISAKDVAEYLISHPEKVNYSEHSPQESLPMLRRQWNYIQLNEKIKAQLLNHLSSLLYTTMPEILNFSRNGMPQWLLRILREYPSYEALENAGLAKLTQLPYVSTAKAQRLLKLIRQGVGDSDAKGVALSAQIIASIASQILELEEHIQHHKRCLEHNYTEAQAQVDLLKTFIGIAVYSAVGLLLNIPGGINSFASAKKLASFWGIHPIYKQSGDGSWGFHMSKAGRSEPRAILYRVTWSAMQYNPVIKDLYRRCLAKGMKPKAAMGVCMHKTLRIVYGMLQNKTPFNPEIDRQNQLKYQSTPKPDSNSKEITTEQFDQNAPISHRQYKKRKKQTQSQDESFVKCGINESAFSL